MLARVIAALLPAGNWKRRFEEVTEIDALPVAEAGVDPDGTPFVRLEDGPVFYGQPARRVHRLVHRWLAGSRLRKRVPVEAYAVAWDILHRYWRGGHCNQQAHYQLKPGDTVIEAGAYIGYYTLRMSQDVGPTGRVIAIEPVAENRAIIERNLLANGYENVTVLPYGVSDRSGTSSFFLTERQKNSLSRELAESRGDVQARSLEVRTLDDIVSETRAAPPNLVILTVNGVELEALRGMREQLDQHGPAVVVAAKYIVDGKPVLDSVVEFLEEHGYETTLDRQGFVKNEHPDSQAVVYGSVPRER